MRDPLLDALPDAAPAEVDPLLAAIPNAVSAPDLPAADVERLMNQEPFGYQRPVGNLLNKQPARPTMADPAMKNVPAMPAQLAPQDPGAAQAAVRQQAQANLQALGDQAQPDVMSTASGFAKGAAGVASMGTYRPQVGHTEQPGATMGQIAGGMGALALAPIAPELVVPAMTAQQTLPATAGNVQPTGELRDPAQAAVSGAFAIALSMLPPAAGQSLAARVSTGAGLGEIQALATEAVNAKARDGQLDLTNNDAVVNQITQTLMGAAFGMAHQQTPRPDAPHLGPEAAARPVAGVPEVRAQAWNEARSMGQPPAPDPLLAAIPDATPAPVAPRERGIFDAAPVPEDMKGRQFIAGTEAATAQRQAELQREPALVAHEAAVRASVEAENNLRGAFPDPDVSPRYPAERDRLRELTAKHQNAERAAAEARAALDAINETLAGTKKKAEQAAPVGLPEGLSENQLRGRQEAIQTMKDAGLPPDQIHRLTQALDLRPDLYHLGSKAANLDAQTRSELGLDVPRESASKEAPRISLETVDFGENSPFQAKFPQINDMPFEKKAALSRKMAAFVEPYASEASGVRGKSLAPDSPPGFWESYPMRPNAQFEASVPFEKMKDYAAAQGYLHQQDAVFVMKQHEGGQKVGIEFHFEGGRPSPEKLGEFWTALRKEAPDLLGAMPTQDGLILARDENPSQIEELKAKYGAAIDRAEQATGLSTHRDFVSMDWELVQSGGWKNDGGGDGYLGRFEEGQRTRLRGVHPKYEARLREVLGGDRQRTLLQEHDPAHGGPVGDGSGGDLHKRFGIDPEQLVANTPDAAKSVYRALGNKVADKNTSADLKIYPLNDLPAEAIPKWLEREGWNYKIFGPDQETGKFVPPNFKEFSYDNKHVWIFSPWTEHGSFRDTEYTRTWRVTHEVAHGQTNEALSQKYGGVGKRQGAIGRATKFNGRDVPALSLADGLRAIEWEHETFRRQREILEQDLGVKITDEQFRKENSINLSDAVYRVLTGDFSNPGELGLVPTAMPPEQALRRAKEILRTQAKDMGLDMAETFGGKKPEALAQRTGDKEINGAFVPGEMDKKSMVYLIKGKADASTVIHEWLGHGLEDRLREARPDLIEEASSLMAKDIGAEAAGKDGSWTTEGKEWFARKVEQYFYEGNTDVPTLKPLFELIRGYMQKIYSAVTGGPMGKAISAEERAYFDKIFGGEAKKGEATAPETVNQGTADMASGASGKLTPMRGAEKQGVSLPEEVKPTAPKSQIPGERSLPKTLEENGLPGGTSREYKPKSHAETMAKVTAELEKKGLDKAAQEILAKDKPSAEQTAKAISIMKAWQHEADAMPAGADKEALLEKTVGLATEMSKRLTNLGQAIEAVKIIESLSPDGVLFYAQRKINNLNEHRPPARQLPPLTPAQATDLRAVAKDLSTETAFADEAKTVANIANKLGGKKELPPEDLAALKAFRDRMVEYLGDKPQRVQKGVMAPHARTPKQDIESITSMLEAREKAAMDRLAAKGFQPTKALFQAKAKLGDAEIEDLADIFASRLSKRGDKSVAAIKQSFKESFGPEIAPYLDKVAQRGAQKLSKARGERAKLAALVARVDEILAPLVESGEPALSAQAEKLRGALFELRNLTGDARLEASQDLQAALQALAPASLGQQVSSVQTIAQLLNPKTLARNVIGNELFYHLERLSKWVATPIDYAASKLTGERTLSFRTEGQGGYWKAFLTGSKAAARGVSPGGLESQYDLQAPAFRGKKNPFTYLERALGIALRSTDYAAYTRAKNQTLGELAALAADKVGVPAGSRKQFVENWIRNADDRVAEIADAYGKYATFQDDTQLSKMASAIKRGMNVATYFGTVKDPRWGMGDLILKYPKTPANIFMRAMDYSPAGFARSAYLLAEPILNGNTRNQREMSMALSRALVGTLGMTGMAYYLANQGIISGRTEKDKDTREFMQNETGQRNFQVNISALSRWVNSGFDEKKLSKQEGDRLMSYDWMQPMAINIAMAAEANKSIGDKKHPIEGAVAAAGAGAMAGVQALQDQPFMQGITQIVGDKNSNVAEKLATILEGAPASFVPTVVNQVKQLMDNSKRETRAPTMLQRTMNKVIAKIPFFSEKLPAAYKTVSPEPKEMYQDGSNSLWNVFVNPAFMAKYKLDPMMAAFIGPYEAEGRTQQFPFVAPKKLQYTDGREKKSLELSGEDYSALQRSIAQNTIRAFQGIDYEALKAKSYEDQEKEMGTRVKKAWEQSRVEFLKERGIHFKP